MQLMRSHLHWPCNHFPNVNCAFKVVIRECKHAHWIVLFWYERRSVWDAQSFPLAVIATHSPLSLILALIREMYDSIQLLASAIVYRGSQTSIYPLVVYAWIAHETYIFLFIAQREANGRRAMSNEPVIAVTLPRRQRRQCRLLFCAVWRPMSNFCFCSGEFIASVR